MRLLDESVPGVTVIRGDGNWTALGGEASDPLACGRQNRLFADFCEPADPGSIDASDVGYQAVPFGIHVRQEFRTRCAPSEAEEALERAARNSEEHRIGEVLWSGDMAINDNWNGQLYFESDLVQRTAPGSNIEATIAATLKAARDENPDLQPILHLGVGAALDVGRHIRVLDIPYIVNTGYPVNGVAVSGSITVRIGSVQTLNSVDESNNRQYIEGSYFAAISFDPCLARLSGVTTS